jgi:hypothetical protein
MATLRQVANLVTVTAAVLESTGDRTSRFESAIKGSVQAASRFNRSPVTQGTGRNRDCWKERETT